MQGKRCCERFNRTLHRFLVTLDEKAKNKGPKHVSELVAQYSAPLHATTGCSPFQLISGREANLPRDPVVINYQEETLDEWVSEMREIQTTIWELAKEAVNKQKQITRKHKDERGKETSCYWKSIYMTSKTLVSCPIEAHMAVRKGLFEGYCYFVFSLQVLSKASSSFLKMV